jgi:hypothetical protein
MIDLAVISAIVARDRVAGHFAGPAATPRNLARRSLVQALGDRR